MENTKSVKIYLNGATKGIYINTESVARIASYFDGCGCAGTAYRLPTGHVAFGYDIETALFAGGICSHPEYFFENLREFRKFVTANRYR